MKRSYEDRRYSKEVAPMTPQLQRSTRESRAPVRYSPSAQNYLLLTENGEPESYSEALMERRHYRASGCSEVKRMSQNGSKRLVLSIVAVEDLHLEQLDVKTSFLHGDLDEDIYMTQPESFQSARKKENLVCKLKKIGARLKTWQKSRGEAQETLSLRFVCTKADINSYAVGVVSKDMSNPRETESIWKLSSGCYAYSKGTSKATLYFSRKEVILEGFSDSDYGELDRAQTEYRLFCDNQRAIHLAKNPVFHGRTKHIKIRYHSIRELVSEGTLSLKKILRSKNPADMLTNVVTTKC
ncbi:retrovirus-related pol polyprotein from transposon TNT 1-94 [Tanacetum coccineum]